jgi:hypothetical protein
MIYLSPDELFDQYIFHSQLLPDNPASWGLTLAHQFYASLTEDCRANLAVSYLLPDPASLITKSAQLAALRILRTLAVKEQTTLDHDRSRIEKACRRLIGNTRTTTHHLETTSDPNHSTSRDVQPTTPRGYATAYASPAEQTLKKHRIDPKLIDTPDGPRPYDQDSGFTSPYPVDFPGCLGCGASDHVLFKDCPHQNDREYRTIFFANLHAHKPHTKPASKRAPPTPTTQPLPPLSQQPTRPSSSLPPMHAYKHTSDDPTTPTVTFTQPVTQPPNGHLPTPPTSILKRPSSADQLTEQSKKPHHHTVNLYVQHAHVLQQQPDKPARIGPMPITVDNLLPVLSMELGQEIPAGFILAGLCDSCGALNTGYTPFHQWIYATYPHLVNEYRAFDDNDPFEPIKLLGAIRHPSDYNESEFGLLTAIIRYNTPYKNANGEPLTISFALGNDVSTNTIFGLPTLDALQLVWDITSNSAVSKSCGVTFPIQRRGSKRGLPDGITFDATEFQRSFAATTVTSPQQEHADHMTATHRQHATEVHDEFTGNTLTRRHIGNSA